MHRTTRRRHRCLISAATVSSSQLNFNCLRSFATVLLDVYRGPVQDLSACRLQACFGTQLSLTRVTRPNQRSLLLCSMLCSVLFMVALWNRADHYIFALWFLLSIFFFSSPNLSSRSRRLDVCHTPTHGVALHGSLQIQDAKKSPKIAIWAPSHNFVGLYLRN